MFLEGPDGLLCTAVCGAALLESPGRSGAPSAAAANLRLVRRVSVIGMDWPPRPESGSVLRALISPLLLDGPSLRRSLRSRPEHQAAVLPPQARFVSTSCLHQRCSRSSSDAPSAIFGMICEVTDGHQRDPKAYDLCHAIERTEVLSGGRNRIDAGEPCGLSPFFRR